MDDIIWQDPPPLKRRTGEHGRVAKFVAALRQRPGEWGLYPHSRTISLASQARRAYPGTEWTTRRQPDGKSDLYARWVGEPDN